jgi:hypothetical protein
MEVEDMLQVVLAAHLLVPDVDVLLVLGEPFDKVHLIWLRGHGSVQNINHHGTLDQSALAKLFFD